MDTKVIAECENSLYNANVYTPDICACTQKCV